MVSIGISAFCTSKIVLWSLVTNLSFPSFLMPLPILFLRYMIVFKYKLCIVSKCLSKQQLINFNVKSEVPSIRCCKENLGFAIVISFKRQRSIFNTGFINILRCESNGQSLKLYPSNLT